MMETPVSPESISLRPIGVVVTDFQDFSQRTDYQGLKEILIREDLEPGLRGLEDFSHLYVFYHQHRSQEWQVASGWTQDPRRGVFTSRLPVRPAGLGSCVCELVRREGHRLFVRGLDAFHGSAVLDLKVYLPCYDSFPEASGPLQTPESLGLRGHSERRAAPPLNR